MLIKSLEIGNFKSLRKVKLIEPNNFTAFVGPNAAGKSNLFEALEFLNTCETMFSWEALRLFGRMQDILYNKIESNDRLIFDVNFSSTCTKLECTISFKDEFELDSEQYYGLREGFEGEQDYTSPFLNEERNQFFNFTRLFIGNEKLKKRNLIDDLKLALDASNLEKVLKRVLKDENTKEEIIEWLSILIPEFKNLEVRSDDLTNTDSLLLFEKHSSKPFTKTLLSDGTWNIISILTALYQTKSPQFLLIEEPENGLNPKVAKELVTIFRQVCKEKGHFVWINTHSQSIVSELTSNEIILVDKIEGETRFKQIKDFELNGLKMDEALFTNAIGGGIPW